MKVIELFSILAFTFCSVSEAKTVTNLYRIKSARCFDWDYSKGKDESTSCTPLFFKTLKLTIYEKPHPNKVCVQVGFNKQCFRNGFSDVGRKQTIIESISDFNSSDTPDVVLKASRETHTEDDSGPIGKVHREEAWINDDSVLLYVDDGTNGLHKKGITYNIELFSTRTTN